jgi:hypothetical protein
MIADADLHLEKPGVRSWNSEALPYGFALRTGGHRP